MSTMTFGRQRRCHLRSLRQRCDSTMTSHVALRHASTTMCNDSVASYSIHTMIQYRIYCCSPLLFLNIFLFSNSVANWVALHNKRIFCFCFGLCLFVCDREREKEREKEERKRDPNVYCLQKFTTTTNCQLPAYYLRQIDTLIQSPVSIEGRTETDVASTEAN